MVYSVVPGNVHALSGCHYGPHSSSIKYSILNWHDRLFMARRFEDQPGKVANPARGQLNRENEYFSVRVRA